MLRTIKINNREYMENYKNNEVSLLYNNKLIAQTAGDDVNALKLLTDETLTDVITWTIYNHDIPMENINFIL